LSVIRCLAQVAELREDRGGRSRAMVKMYFRPKQMHTSYLFLLQKRKITQTLHRKEDSISSVSIRRREKTLNLMHAFRYNVK
jgi:hypothetical protein